MPNQALQALNSYKQGRFVFAVVSTIDQCTDQLKGRVGLTLGGIFICSALAFLCFIKPARSFRAHTPPIKCILELARRKASPSSFSHPLAWRS